jgi:c-di-GMP-binding flagellar brake protein YcgR
MDNRRKNPRAQVVIAAELETDGDTLSGETRDLSAGGVSVLLEQGLAEGLTLDLSLILTEDGIEDAEEEAFCTKAAVIWAAPTDGGQTMIGLRFKETAPQDAQRLQRFLRAISAAAEA